MSTTYEFGLKAAVGEPTDEQSALEGEEAWEPHPSVDQEIQARIDYADDRDSEGRLFGQTLEAEERMKAREWEIERTRTRMDRSQTADREARCRVAVVATCRERQRDFAERAGSVDRWRHPDEPDAREQLSREELAQVNQGARRIRKRLGGWTTAAVSRLVAERAVESSDIDGAALETYERLAVDPGGVVPIGRIGDVRSREVSIAGRVVTLWDPSHPKIAQVGLLEDESGRTKFTAWRKSNQPTVEEGDQVRVRDAVKGWYEGRCSIAFTGRTRVEVVRVD